MLRFQAEATVADNLPGVKLQPGSVERTSSVRPLEGSSTRAASDDAESRRLMLKVWSYPPTRFSCSCSA